MARVANWQNNLSQLIEEKRAAPFDFPNWNCLMWAFACIEAVTEKDLGLNYRGKYKNELGASRLLKKIDNVGTSQELLEKYLGATRSIAFARYGDIVFADPAGTGLDLPLDTDLFGPVPGVCYGSISFFVGEFGLVPVDTLRLGQAIWVS